MTRLFLISLVCLPTLVTAQDGDGFTFGLGAGVQTKPGYFGSDEYVVGPRPAFDFESLRFGTIDLGGDREAGLGFSPSFRIIGAREADEFDELTGLEDVDFTVEAGGGLVFNAPEYELYAKLRYGVIGHESLVAEVGGDLYYRPSDQITLSAGPRVLWGSDDYAQTYFGVTDAESDASSFDSFEAGAGIMSAGIEAEAQYQFNDNWGVTGTIRYDQLQEDAADSPITQSDDQLSASVVITRRITLDF